MGPGGPGRALDLGNDMDAGKGEMLGGFWQIFFWGGGGSPSSMDAG